MACFRGADAGIFGRRSIHSRILKPSRLCSTLARHCTASLIPLMAGNKGTLAKVGERALATKVGALPKQEEWAKKIFQKAFSILEGKFLRSEMVFPKDIMWLAGAPGAGKSTLTPDIMELRSLTLEPIEVSALLTSDACKLAKERGDLVPDEEVLALLLEALIERNKLDPFGVIIDGFPRTPVQAHCIPLLFDEMRALRREFWDGAGDARFRRPIFHITVLFLPKAESVRRQVARGQAALEHNRRVEELEVGHTQLVRATDLDEAFALKRYAHFQDTLLDSLNVVKHRFHFHFGPLPWPRIPSPPSF